MGANNAAKTALCCLVADDNVHTLEVLAAFLRSHGYGVDLAENGQAALARYLAAPERYGFILLDINMPVMGGCEAARRIRESGCPRAGWVPIVAMTAGPLPGPENRSFTACLRKPFHMQALLGLLADLPARMMAR